MGSELLRVSDSGRDTVESSNSLEYEVSENGDMPALADKLKALMTHVFKKSGWENRDSILVIYPSGLMNTLDSLFHDSPEFRVQYKASSPTWEPFGALYVRSQQMQKQLDLLLIALNQFNNRLNTPTGKMASLYWDHRFSDKFSTLANKFFVIGRQRLNYEEWHRMAGDRYLKGKKAFLHLRLDLLDRELRAVVEAEAPNRPNCKHDQLRQRNAEKQKGSEQRQREETEQFFDGISPDLTAAYRLVEDLAAEATSLGESLTVEDEYFVEQTRTDYIPEIIAALKKAEGTSAQFQNKEAMVGEALKQFRILHAGLHRIIEKGVQQQVSGMQAQTDFLTRKVLGDSSLTLTTDEAWEIVEGDASEAERVRDALYQNHVAPALKANREDYERRLRADQMRFDAIVRAQQMDVETARSRWKEAAGHAKVSRERNADLEDRFDRFYAKYKKLDADYKQLSAEHSETLAGFKTALDLIKTLEEQVIMYKELTASHDAGYLTEEPMEEDPDEYYSTHAF